MPQLSHHCSVLFIILCSSQDRPNGSLGIEAASHSTGHVSEMSRAPRQIEDDHVLQTGDIQATDIHVRTHKHIHALPPAIAKEAEVQVWKVLPQQGNEADLALSGGEEDHCDGAAALFLEQLVEGSGKLCNQLVDTVRVRQQQMFVVSARLGQWR